ncbi:unnamed protein product [Rotaria sp. Silwood2]|nr:unnamed protein product [Rotaria sp. Silwood2]CAF4225412.1 unnamed protein product [Rotaria sp. Silwood2]
MDTENTTDERNQSISKGTITTKLRMKDRSRSQTTPTSTDINDPENLDYEDIDDNHSPGKLEDNHELEQINNPVKQINDETKTSINIQDEEDKPLNKPQEINNNNNNNTSSSMIDNSAAASDEGEVDEADLEDGEIHDPSTSKNRTPFTDDQTSEQNRNRINTNISSSPQAKVHCRFFLQGRCHWGPNCKFIHPNNDSTKNSSGPSIDALSSINNEISPPVPTGIPIPQTTTNNAWISPQATTTTSQFFPNPVLRGATQPSGIPLVVPPTGTESAWERGLRSAKTLREQSMRRKQQDKDFNDKKFNLTIRDAQDDKDGDDNILNIDRPSSIDYDLNNLPGSNYADQRTYSDRYHPYMYTGSSGNSHYNNNHHRNNNNNARNNNNNNNNNNNHNNTSSTNDHSDRRLRHSDDYAETRNDNRIRKENSSTKHSKSTSKKDDSSSSSYKRNLSQQQYTSGSHHNNDTQLHFNPYSSRRGDDWQDPWDRSRNHGSGNHRSSGGGRERSYSSSSSATSSRSRSRSRPKRRSPSVTRATKPTTTTKSSEMVKNGNEKKSNSNKKLVSPTTTTTAAANKFLPGRQISSHTLKKAEKSSNTSNSMVNNHSKDQHGKDSDINIKKQIRKENPSRSDSTSSSSSSDSDTNRITHRSSSTSSESSSSENDMRTSTKTKTASGGGKTTVGSTSSSSHTTKTINRQLSSSSGGGSKNTNTKSKNDSINRESSKTKESSLTSAKKRRDTSSSTGSASTTKKTKLNIDSHKSSTDANNAENSDSCKKKEKQKILKKLQEVEKLINQRSTKTSS